MKVIMPAANMDLNNDGKVTIDELARSTGLIYAQIVIAASAVVWGIWVLIVGAIPQVVTFLRVEGAIVAFSAPLAAYIGIKRMLRYERIEEREQKAWEFQRKRDEWELRQAMGIATEAGATTMTQAQVDATAQQILSRYYTGKEWSREAMVKANVTTAELWNEANATLKKRRIRKGKKRELEPDTFAEAWGIYCEEKLRQNRHKLGGRDWREAD